MCESLSIESLEKKQIETIGKFRANRQIAEALIKAGDLLIGKSYLREAFMLNREVSRMEKQLDAVKSSI